VGHFDNEQWIPTRLLNGDESCHNEEARVFGRTFEFFVELTNEERLWRDSDAYTPATKQKLVTIGVCKGITCKRKKLPI
jgi:hypothetical protein